MRRSSTDLLSTMVGQNFELEFSTVSLHPHGLYEEALSFRVSKAVLLRDKRDFPFFCFRGIAAITLPKRGFSGSTFKYQEADILLSSLGTNYCVSFAGPSITLSSAHKTAFLSAHHSKSRYQNRRAVPNCLHTHWRAVSSNQASEQHLYWSRGTRYEIREISSAERSETQGPRYSAMAAGSCSLSCHTISSWREFLEFNRDQSK